ncbi:MAG: hypothetical protein Q8908_13710 [Bacteroidota bacterium]|nr:hypothetical protein [Bacteroidota bacterium]
METSKAIPASFSEADSQRLMREMINISRERISSHGILFILWGWINFVNFFAEYLSGIITFNYQLIQIERSARIVLPILGLIFTVIYAILHLEKVNTYINVTLRYVWISVFMCLVLTNIIQFNVLRQIYFNLQHPIFMLFIAFAIVVSGGILRHRIILAGGILFALLALISSMVDMQVQMLIESIGWLIAFIIPGHITYAKRRKQSKD